MIGSLFTIVCEFKGGTYVSQVHAPDDRRALRAWAELIQTSRPMGNDADEIALEAMVDEGAPVALDGLVGAWCWTATADRQLVLANIVRSDFPIGDPGATDRASSLPLAPMMAAERRAPRHTAADYNGFVLTGLFGLIDDAEASECDPEGIALLVKAREIFWDEFQRRHPGAWGQRQAD